MAIQQEIHCGSCKHCISPKGTSEGICFSPISPLKYEGVLLDKSPLENLKHYTEGIGFGVPEDQLEPETKMKKKRLFTQVYMLETGSLDCGAKPRTRWQNLSRLFERTLPKRDSSKAGLLRR